MQSYDTAVVFRHFDREILLQSLLLSIKTPERRISRRLISKQLSLQTPLHCHVVSVKNVGVAMHHRGANREYHHPLCRLHALDGRDNHQSTPVRHWGRLQGFRLTSSVAEEHVPCVSTYVPKRLSLLSGLRPLQTIH